MKKAYRLLVLGYSVLLGQFTFITGGTFIYFSWGIMEPIAYTMLLGNFVASFFFFNWNRKNLEAESLQQMWAERFSKRKYVLEGVHLTELEKLEREIKELRSILYKRMA